MTELEKTGGSKLPPLRNPPKMEYTDDLTNLSYLNEPAGKSIDLVFREKQRLTPISQS
jgi:hypothetical protein